MAPLRPGDLLPDAAVVRPDGASVSLRDDLQGEATLLVFLRHLGWLPCREHLGEVAEAREALGRRVAVVTFAPAPLLARFEAQLGLEIGYYGDPERASYAAFGFGRGSVARVWLDPRVLARYARLLARGRRPQSPGAGEDLLQLGGDVLADASGRIEWTYRSSGPEDRPSLAEILAAGG